MAFTPRLFRKDLLSAGRRFSTKQYSSKEMIDECMKHTMFSWSAQNKISPIPMVRSKGVHFWDADDKKYMDFNAQLMCSNLGHQHPRIIEAIKRQADELMYAGPACATRVRAEVGGLLAEVTPGDLDHFFFTLGGAESNENAIKFARFSTGRHKLMSRYRGYHGATHGAISLTGDPRRWPNEPAMNGVIRAFDPYMYRSHLYVPGMTELEFSAKCLEQMEEQMMYENPESIAAVFVETVTGSNGLIIPPEGYLQGLRKLTEKYGILLVCDEVMAGVGRTGKYFACQHWDVVPDILVMAKGLTGASLPLGCVAVSPKIMAKFQDKPFSGGLTYQSHPMCLAVAAETLKVLKDEDVVGNSARMGKVMARRMAELKEKHVSVGDARNIGLFGAFELVKNRETKEMMSPFGAPPSEPMAKLTSFLKENGMFSFAFNNLLHTNPPLTITEDELNWGFDLIDRGLDITDKYTH